MQRNGMKESIYPKDAINAAHEMGILNLHIPEKYGGLGLGYHRGSAS